LITFVIGCVVFVAVPVILQCIGEYLKIQSRHQKTLQEMNRILHHKHVLVCLSDNGYLTGCSGRQLWIQFRYYDWTPCLDYTKNLLERERTNQTYNTEMQDAGGDLSVIEERPEHTNQDNIRKEALKKLLYYSMEYGYLLSKLRLKKPAEPRHTRQLECLCQFAESLIMDKTLKSATCIKLFGGRSRNPVRRWFCYDT